MTSPDDIPPRQKVQLYLSGQELKSCDFFGKSDPFVRVFVHTDNSEDSEDWELLGETEWIENTSNPTFVKTFTIDFIFEIRQKFKFQVFDKDHILANDLIGETITTFADILGAKKQSVSLTLRKGDSMSTGVLHVKADKLGKSQSKIYWQWSGMNLLDVGGCFTRSSPFLKFMKIKGEEGYLEVSRTEHFKDNLNPIWNMMILDDDRICGGVPNRPFRIECWSRKNNDENLIIGVCETTLEELQSGKTDFVLAHPTKGKGKAGILKVLSFYLSEKYTFLDYIRAGEQLNLITAIDFTKSNLEPEDTHSLHAFKPYRGGPNEYQKVITQISNIVLAYHHSKYVPIYGFGAKPCYPELQEDAVSHCFPLTGDRENACVYGLEGIMEAYNETLKSAEFMGPTYISPMITEAAKLAQEYKTKDMDIYTILLIITDGEINDFKKTVDTVIAASNLPLSIVIIGVGNEDFGKMVKLDNDTRELENEKGAKAVRDFVQFVPFRNYRYNAFELTKHILAEIPSQFEEYKELINKKPKFVVRD